ncbi:MAG: ferredoxin [Elusimicrobia bacterium GWA2_69_24]|nr:MAG: ferredoxin [Elusimicrobia bacterium GWA2_69_24]
MIELDPEKKPEAVLEAARLICAAARTAPKGRGKDLLVTAIIAGAVKSRLTRKMREIAARDDVQFFERDADCLDRSLVVVLLGSRKEALGLPHCGCCGFPDCAAMAAAGGTCTFNSTDLGIAVGSAAGRAADLRLDSRVMYSAGKAALELGLLGKEVRLAYALPLSVSAKSPFFDRT